MTTVGYYKLLRYLLPKHMRDKLVRPRTYALRHKQFTFVEKLSLVHLRNYACNKHTGRGKLILQHQNINCCQLTEILDFW